MVQLESATVGVSTKPPFHYCHPHAPLNDHEFIANEFMATEFMEHEFMATANDENRTTTLAPPIRTIPLQFHRSAPTDQTAQSAAFLETMQARRTVRDFSPEPVPFALIENAIRTAATAPSGANRQPWHFVVVTDPEIKRTIRVAAEEEEREFYQHRAPQDWLDALAPLGTDSNKPFLEVAPYLLVVFRQDYNLTTGMDGQEVKSKNYYVQESVGLACGLLLASLHQAGLVTLTHTPSPMGFLGEILNRPKNEKPFLLIPVGYPAPDARVPDISKKPLDEVMTVASSAKKHP